ncbi:hypothetical protein Moror_15140 [Moniliophthora roreri MCA 2997]|uniref:Uncharacterized protein n=1 Tax=Moniliophthora roreri (strain MCA 2997) TaxID=1381753 RepID=V2X2W1_MONRO|nr:hypothetical protein Moror_15140 [Moniliophthora roreri MCA 2997]
MTDLPFTKHSEDLQFQVIFSSAPVTPIEFVFLPRDQIHHRSLLIRVTSPGSIGKNGDGFRSKALKLHVKVNKRRDSRTRGAAQLFLTCLTSQLRTPHRPWSDWQRLSNLSYEHQHIIVPNIDDMKLSTTQRLVSSISQPPIEIPSQRGPHIELNASSAKEGFCKDKVSYDLAQQVLEGVPSESSLRSYAPEASTIPEVTMDNLTAFDSRHIPTSSSAET